jgi:hypothetical protein
MIFEIWNSIIDIQIKKPKLLIQNLEAKYK